MQNKKLYAIVLVLVVFVAIFALSPAISSLMDNVVIRSTGNISTKIFARSGSAGDIQAAVDAVAAAGGGTVYVPEGDFVFSIDPNKIAPQNAPTGVLIPGGVNVIGAGKDLTILRTYPRPPDSHYMFTVDGRNGKFTRISGISFIGYNFTEEGNPHTSGIALVGAEYRIDHCYFQDFSGSAIFAFNHYIPYGANRGLIDHCDFDNPYIDDPNVIGPGGGEKLWPYGIHVGGTGFNWEPIDNLLGKYDTVNNIAYIEDNTFKRMRHATVGSTIGGGFYVLRYNTITRPAFMGMIDVHGSYGEAPYVGGRGLEAYNNTIIWNAHKNWGGAYMFLLRGGSGVVFNNTMVYETHTGSYPFALWNEGPNPTTYIKDLYIWDNTISGTDNLIYITGGDIIENEDYFLYAKPGYTPYPYPHPLTTELTP